MPVSGGRRAGWEGPWSQHWALETVGTLPPAGHGAGLGALLPAPCKFPCSPRCNPTLPL